LLSGIAKLLWSRTPAEIPTDRRQLGMQGKRLLEDPVLALALDRIDRDLIETILGSAVSDTEAREAAYRLHWAKEQLRTQLALILGDAKVLEAEDRRAQERDEAEAKRREGR